jgi:hypothetical protein
MWKIEQWSGERWFALGGQYASRGEAEEKIGEFLMCSSEKKVRHYRIVRA